MENIKDFFKNRKILILNKKDAQKFEKNNVFKEANTEYGEIEKVYKNLVYHGNDGYSRETLIIGEKNYDVNLCHAWKIEEFIFLSEEEFCEDFDDFIRYHVMENDYELIPEPLFNYAKRYEKSDNKYTRLEKKGQLTTEAEKVLHEEAQKILDNATKRAYKEYYIGEIIVIKINF